MKKWRLLFSIVLMILYIGSTLYALCCSYSEMDTAMPTANQPSQEPGDAYVSSVNMTNARKTNYYQCDATADHIFFSYSQDNCVDVYSYTGEFCFTIYLPEYPKSVVMLRCTHDRVYIRDKTDHVYVYAGSSQVEDFSKAQAEMMGYDYRWFQDNAQEICVAVSRDVITLKDEKGRVYQSIDTPNSIRRNIPAIDFGRDVNIGIALLLMLGLVLVGGRLMYKSIKEAESKSRHRLT